MTNARARAQAFLVVAGLAHVVALAACDDSDDSLDIPDGGLLGMDAAKGADTAPAVVDCTRIAQGFCDVFARCVKGWVEAAFGDVTTCVSRLRLGCEDSKTAPGSTLTVATQNQCLQGLAAASCADLIDRKFSGCDIPGTRVDGMGCAHNGQCASNLCKFGSGMCGTCGPKAVAGGVCSKDEDCGAALVCPEGDGTRRCVARATMGMTCSKTQPCAHGFACDGTCVAAGKAGDACRRSQGDLVGTCDGMQFLYCGSSNVCQAIPTAPAGQPCGLVNGGYVACAGGTYCRVTGLSFTGVCANQAADGTTCSTAAAGPPCIAPAMCVDGLCKLPSALQCQ